MTKKQALQNTKFLPYKTRTCDNMHLILKTMFVPEFEYLYLTYFYKASAFWPF